MTSRTDDPLTRAARTVILALCRRLVVDRLDIVEPGVDPPLR